MPVGLLLVGMRHVQQLRLGEMRTADLQAHGQLARETDSVLGAFVRGQLLVMLGLAIYYAIALKLVGLDVGPLILFFIANQRFGKIFGYIKIVFPCQ